MKQRGHGDAAHAFMASLMKIINQKYMEEANAQRKQF